MANVEMATACCLHGRRWRKVAPRWRRRCRRRGDSMPWHSTVACFFGGAFLANFFLHLIAGLSGRPFPTPFAKPPFRGPSPPVVNVLYALFNLAVAYSLLVLVGTFELRRVARAAGAAAGGGRAAGGGAGAGGGGRARAPRAPGGSARGGGRRAAQRGGQH